MRCGCCLQASEVTVEYTNCRPDSEQLRFTYGTCAEYIESHVGHRCFCDVEFQLTHAFLVGHVHPLQQYQFCQTDFLA